MDKEKDRAERSRKRKLEVDSSDQPQERQPFMQSAETVVGNLSVNLAARKNLK